MDRDEAARLLGVAPTASPAEARAAFRALIRAHHPDRAGVGATAGAARLIEAHQVLQAPPPPPGPRRAGPPGAGAPGAGAEPGPSVGVPWGATPGPDLDEGTVTVAGDSLLVRADAATVMARLVEAGHALGEITYLDRSSGYLEVLLQVLDEEAGHPVAVSLVASLQGRLDAVEVFCTAERLDGHPAPPVAPLATALATEMARG